MAVEKKLWKFDVGCAKLLQTSRRTCVLAMPIRVDFCPQSLNHFKCTVDLAKQCVTQGGKERDGW